MRDVRRRESGMSECSKERVVATRAWKRYSRMYRQERKGRRERRGKRAFAGREREYVLAGVELERERGKTLPQQLLTHPTDQWRITDRVGVSAFHPFVPARPQARCGMWWVDWLTLGRCFVGHASPQEELSGEGRKQGVKSVTGGERETVRAVRGSAPTRPRGQSTQTGSARSHSLFHFRGSISPIFPCS